MKKTLAIIMAALGCATANAQEINAVVARQSNTTQEMVRLTNTPNVILNENGITLKEGETNVENYSFNDGNITILFGSAISEETAIGEGLAVTHPVVIESGGKLTVSGTMSNDDAQDLIIEDGGQLAFNSGTVNAKVKKVITGYGTGNGNWYLVASPISEATPAAVGMIDQTTPANYDLYIFDQSGDADGKEWLNNKVQGQEIESLEIQNGYLYAHKNGTTLTFNGELIASASAKPLAYDGNATFKGFNLIGNPYTCNATIGRLFYRMNGDGDEIILAENIDDIIAPCEGVMVMAAQTGESASFSKASSRGQQREMLSMTLSQGSSTIDRAIIQFGKGETLDKFMLNTSNTKLFIPQNDKEFAAVATQATAGEMPVSFKASKDGKYTITVNTENVEAEYLHLIDNLTGEDTDLLACPTYSFNANTSDYASRFKLVFSVKDTEPAEVTDTFAFISNGEIIISNEGRATLQLIDAMGRIIRNQQIEGEARISTQGLTAGVYVLTLNGNVQKIVVR